MRLEVVLDFIVFGEFFLTFFSRFSTYYPGKVLAGANFVALYLSNHWGLRRKLDHFRKLDR